MFVRGQNPMTSAPIFPQFSPHNAFSVGRFEQHSNETHEPIVAKLSNDMSQGYYVPKVETVLAPLFCL